MVLVHPGAELLERHPAGGQRSAGAAADPDVRAGADLVVRVLCRAEPFGAALYHHLPGGAGCDDLLHHLLLLGHADLLGAAHGLHLAVHAYLRLRAGLWQRLGGRGPFLAGPGLLDPRLRHGHQLLEPPPRRVRRRRALALGPTADHAGHVPAREVRGLPRGRAGAHRGLRLCGGHQHLLGELVGGPAEPVLPRHLRGHAGLRAAESCGRHRRHHRAGEPEAVVQVLVPPPLR
mmetsp:Transcript_63635/g.152139  ORF Transcript_63635/g.152139 Transcript_63635/m.152139 type:complete len:233 (+) Transcript_63635:418-1116(+)